MQIYADLTRIKMHGDNVYSLNCVRCGVCGMTGILMILVSVAKSMILIACGSNNRGTIPEIILANDPIRLKMFWLR